MKEIPCCRVGKKSIKMWLVLTASVCLVLPLSEAENDQQAPGGSGSNPAAKSAATATVELAEVAEKPAFWPQEVTLLKPCSFPVLIKGHPAGEIVVPAGTELRLIQVLPPQVEVANKGVHQLVPADSTDLLDRAARLRAAALPATNPAGASPLGAPATLGFGVSTQSTPAQPDAVTTNAAAWPHSEATIDYQARAREVAAEIQHDFWMPNKGLYSDKIGSSKPDFAWGNGVMFSALVGAARNDPEHYESILRTFFNGLNTYWDRGEPLGGYEPLPTNGHGDDKYYDDNEWLTIGFLEANQVTGQSAYSQRAAQTLKFVLSGWDETYLQGGIWWHEKHENKVKCKNTCANGPAAVSCLQLAKISPPLEAKDLIAMAAKITDWTAVNLQMPNGLFADNKNIEGDGIDKVELTYNSALMLRAYLGLYHATGKQVYLQDAQRIGVAASAFLDKKTGVYRDSPKFGHLMAEADLALYRTTKEPYLLQRARRQADAYYDRWKADHPTDLITVASYSRLLWLMADMQTEAGRDFWQKEDAATPVAVSTRFP